MARGKRKVPDINSSSTADIAFLLLIFFLITTSMDTDRGLARLLPPPPEDQDQDNTDKIKERNVLQVYLNKDDALMCGNDYIGVDQLREKAKEFIANVANAEHMPEKTQKNVEFFGTYLAGTCFASNTCAFTHAWHLSRRGNLAHMSMGPNAPA